MAYNLLDTFLDSIPTITGVSPLILLITLVLLILPFPLLVLLAYTQHEPPIPPPPGCKKLGITTQSNLSDQYDSKYDEGGPPEKFPWKVKALFIYPIKSCRGVELSDAEVTRSGLRYDRQFAFAQYVTSLPDLSGNVKSEWQFITQRTFPRMAKVEVEVWVPDPDADDDSEEGAEWVSNGGCVVVRFPFTPDTDSSIAGLKAWGSVLAAKLRGCEEPVVEFRVPLAPTEHRMSRMGYLRETMRVWKDTPVALNMGTEIPSDVLAKLRYTLGVANPLTLFRIDPENEREVFKNAPRKEETGFQTVIGMQDSYPLHIANLSSIHHISSSLPPSHPAHKHLSALRYRANIYISGPPAFAEDRWKRALIGNRKYDFSCRTTRCKLPNVDPDTAERDRNEPDATMRRYRVVDVGSRSACLGMQGCPLEEGEVRVGEEVRVLSEGEHFYLKE